MNERKYLHSTLHSTCKDEWARGLLHIQYKDCLTQQWENIECYEHACKRVWVSLTISVCLIVY